MYEAHGEYLEGTLLASLMKTLPLNMFISSSIAAGVSLKTRPASLYELSTQAPKQGHLLVILTVFIVQLQEVTYREYFNTSEYILYNILTFKVRNSSVQIQLLTSQAHFNVCLYGYIPLSMHTDIDLVVEKGKRTRNLEV